MVKDGLALAGQITGGLEPLSDGNEIAIRVWNDAAAELRFPDVLYHLAAYDVDDLDLMVARLRWLRDVMSEKP